MRGLNKRREEVVAVNNEEPQEKPVVKDYAWIEKLSFVMSGAVFSRESVIKLFPFILYVVLLLMIYITNVYIAEDMSREIARYTRLSEERYVEYIYIKSEITSVTKQSNLAKMLRDTGIKESVDPFKKIVVEKEGGNDD